MNNLLKKLLRLYNFFLVTALIVFGAVSTSTIGGIVSISLLSIIEINLISSYFNRQKTKSILTSIISYASTIASWVVLIVIALGTKGQNIVSLIVFLPLVYDLTSSILKNFKIKKHISSVEVEKDAEEGTVISPDFQIEKRKLLKLFAGTSAGLLLLYLFNPKKANAAFFGSIPGPGTVAIKDSIGTVVDPSTKNPTDGYGIADVDESTATHYYGFIHYNSTDWYVFRESSGVYTYASKVNNSTVSYDTGWANRTTTLVFGPYNEAF